MIFGSILLKTFAFVLAGWSLTAALLCWAAGMGLDYLRYRKLPGALASIRPVVLVNLAAFAAGLAAQRMGDYAAMRWKEGLPGLSHLTDALLSTLQLPAGVHAGDLYLSSMAGQLQFSASLDHLGAALLIMVFAISLVYLLFDAPSLKQVAARASGVAGILLVIAVLRFLFFVLAFTALCDFISYESEELPISPFIRPMAIAAMFLPLLLLAIPLMNRILALQEEPEPEPGFHGGSARIFLPVIFVLCAVVFWNPKGSVKQGEVLINTFHTQWSRTDRPYDRDWYGADSGYNYACMKRLFETFYPVRELKSRITAAELEKASVLIIYIPDQAFSEDEVKLVREFVRGGGGVLLIGDHTNVFGSTSHLNQICTPFGFFFRDDVLFDLDEDFHQLRDLAGRNPAVLHGLDFFKFRGPASIQPTSLGTRSILDIDHSKSVRAIYSVNNFYPPPHDHPQMMTGKFCAAAVSRYGNGRVAAFADSTVFSNFEIFYPGKYEYLVNHVHWLNHRDSGTGKLARRACGFLALLALGCFLFHQRNPRSWLFAFIVSLAAVAAAQRINLRSEQSAGEFPPPVKPANAVFFVADTNDPGFALRAFASEGDYDKRYDVFVQWVLRTGAFSGFYMTGLDRRPGLYEHYRDSDPVQAALGVILRTPEDLPQLKTLAGIPGNGPVLVMAAGSFTAEQLLPVLRETGLVDADAEAQARSAWPAGEVLIENGKRRLLLVTAAERFSDQHMGFSEKVVPDEKQRALYDEAFAVVDRLFGVAPPEPPPEPPPALSSGSE